MEEMRKEKEDRKRREEELDGVFDTSSEEEKDLSGLTKKQRKQYERHLAVIKNLKSQRYPHYLYHELMGVKLE